MNEALATEVFQYIYESQALPPGEDPFVHRLELNHFEFLCQELHLDLDDLSFYLFAYLLGCKGDVSLTIMELEFVRGLVHMQLAFSEESIALLASNTAPQVRFAPVFASIRKCIEDYNTQLRVTCPCGGPTYPSKELELFYKFLYNFVLRFNGDELSSRIELAVELWGMFFDDGEENGASPSSYRHYARFAQRQKWFDFVMSSKFSEARYDEEMNLVIGGHSISADLWHQLLFFAYIPSYDHFDFNAAWPNAIDEFVKSLSSETG